MIIVYDVMMFMKKVYDVYVRVHLHISHHVHLVSHHVNLHVAAALLGQAIG